MSNQQPPTGGVPSDYDRYFRDGSGSRPTGGSGSRPTSGSDIPPTGDAPSGWFRDSAPTVQQNQQVHRYPPVAQQQVISRPSVAPAPAPAPARARKQRGPVRRLLRYLLVFVLIVTLYLGGFAIYTVANINKIDALPADQIRNTPGAVTLIVGSDSLDNNSVDGSRTDTIMLMVDPLWGAPTLVSIPRDSWVEIPGHGRGKINSAFAIGGPQLLVETIEANTGLRVDHYLEVGFLGVVNMADAVGGLELCIDFDVNDANSGLVMSQGCSVLEGQQALAFVRMRYSDPTGDIGRIQRQQQFIGALGQEMLKPQNLFNPFTMKRLADATADNLTVDEGTNAFSLARFGWGMLQISRGSGDVTTVPISNPNFRVSGQSAVQWDDAAARELFRSLGARN